MLIRVKDDLEEVHSAISYSKIDPFEKCNLKKMSDQERGLTFQLRTSLEGMTDVIQWGVDLTEVMEMKNKKLK